MTGEQVGKAAHAAWKAWRIEAGYPDHVYHGAGLYERPPGGSLTWFCAVCRAPEDRHHEDMVEWSDLPEAKREKFIVQGMAGWEARRGREERLLKAARALIDAEFVARFDNAWERLEEETKALEAELGTQP